MAEVFLHLRWYGQVVTLTKTSRGCLPGVLGTTRVKVHPFRSANEAPRGDGGGDGDDGDDDESCRWNTSDQASKCRADAAALLPSLPVATSNKEQLRTKKN